MDLKQMQYFLCLAEVGNVTRAARQLNIVQPALSMQIAKLEAEFGQRLFDRTAHGVATTVAGEALARLLTPIVRDVEHARQEMARFDGRVSGRVVAGLITSVAQSTLASSSARIAAEYPDVALSACEGYTQTLMDWVTTGQLDLAIINAPKQRRGLNAQHILDEEMVFACRQGAPYPAPARLTFADLAGFDLVMPSKRHGLRMILEEQAAEAGIELNPRLEIDTLSAICEVVATTDLVTVLPTIALHQALAAGRVRAYHFAAPSLTRSIAVVHHPRRSVSAAANAVVEVIRQDLVAAASSAARFVHPAGEEAPAAGTGGRRRRGKTAKS
ncbi:LysR family transcriptional regulator [Xanthobacter sp. ZOL 2024]